MSAELAAFYASLGVKERAELEALIAADVVAHPWRPLIDLDHPEKPTPQARAYESQADFLLYGGAAGGGKSDLLIGLALTAHKRSLILRREGKQLAAVVDRIAAICRTRDGFNGASHRWTRRTGGSSTSAESRIPAMNRPIRASRTTSSGSTS
jgi:hypothetical protein